MKLTKIQKELPVEVVVKADFTWTGSLEDALQIFGVDPEDSETFEEVTDELSNFAGEDPQEIQDAYGAGSDFQLESMKIDGVDVY